jgi:transmembrane sensor
LNKGDKEISLSDEERIDQEASDWLAVEDRGFTAKEEKSFEDWLAADPRHGQRWERHKRTWQQMGLLDNLGSETGEVERPKPALRIVPSFWIKPISIAAAIAAAIAIAFIVLKPDVSGPVLLSQNPTALDYERHVLEDGSVVELNKGAQVSVSYSAVERGVRLLSGEAHFTVNKDASRPFVVTARGTAVRAVGTAFSVQINSESVGVMVTEGRVRMEKAVELLMDRKIESEPLLEGDLTMGQRVEVPFRKVASALLVETVTEEEQDRRLAWKDPMLDFVAAPLSEILAEFNRRNEIQLVVENLVLKDLPITATVHTGQPEEFVSILELTEGIVVRRENAERIVLTK